MDQPNLEHTPARPFRFGLVRALSALLALTLTNAAPALTHDGSDGQPSSLFISVLDPDTGASYYRELDATQPQFLDNPALTVNLSTDTQYAGFVGKPRLLFNIAAFQVLAPGGGNLATWGYLLTSTGPRQALGGDFVSIDAVRQRMQVYAAYLSGSSGLAQPGDDAYFDGPHWGPTLGGLVGASTAGSPDQPLAFYRVNNNSGDPAGRRVERLGHWLLGLDGKLEFVRTVSANLPPVATAVSPASAMPGETVTLDGSGSHDPDQGPEALRHGWSRVSGPFVSIAGNQGPVASFIPAAAGTYVFRLTVGDGEASAAATTTVTVQAAANQPPIAKTAPNLSVAQGRTAILDGSGSSDPDQGPKPLAYHWSQTSGPVTVVLVGADTSQASFVAEQTGTYRFTLTISDGASTSEAVSEVLVTPPKVITLNAPPLWQVGARQAIRWEAGDVAPSQPVKLQFAKAGTKFKTLARSTVKKGAANWKPKRNQATQDGTLKACVKPLATLPWACDEARVEVRPRPLHSPEPSLQPGGPRQGVRSGQTAERGRPG